MLKRILKGGAYLALVLLVTLAVSLTYRAYRQHETAQLLVMTTPDAIDEASFVRIGGVDQWIQVRGEHRGNPVVLFLHGGPGFTAIPYFQRVMRTWEHDFTIVHWDQRGAGKSFARNGGAQQPHPTIDQMIADGIEVAEHVRRRLNQPKVILVGYSWGSVLGVEMARVRPDLFYAFVGTGQVVDTVRSETASYYELLQRARAAGDNGSVATLTEIGPPPYAGVEQLSRQRGILNEYPPPGERELNQFRTLLLAPGYSLRDVVDVYFRAPELTREMLAVVLKYKITDRGTSFGLPLFFFQGSDDLWTSTAVVKGYLPLITAPHKEVVLFDRVGHHAVEVSGDQFLAELNARVRPLVQQPSMTAQSPQP
jgi:pimeloyl-ACP methyl ester carboxylesterase